MRRLATTRPAVFFPSKLVAMFMFFFQFDFCLRHKMMTFIHNLSRTCSVVLPAGTRKQLSVTPDIFDLLKNKVRDVMSGRSFSPTWAVFMLSVQQRRSGTFC